MICFLFRQEPLLIVLCPIVVEETENRQMGNFYFSFLLQLPNPLLQGTNLQWQIETWATRQVSSLRQLSAVMNGVELSYVL